MEKDRARIIRSLQSGSLVLLVAIAAGFVPFSDSVDLLIDTFLSAVLPGYGDSAHFVVETRTEFSEPESGDSTAFNLETSLARPAPIFASSVPQALDSGGINRVWADSESFAYNNSTGCVGEYLGNYTGASSGTLEAYYDCDDTISFSFISYFGNVDFQSVVEVEPDGTVFGTFSGATLEGTFDSDDCTASGIWRYSGYSGTWSLARSAPGPCRTTNWLLAPQSVSREVSSGLFGMALAMAEPFAWSAEVVQGSDWLRITAPQAASGAGSAILWAQFDENPNATSRPGTIRVTAPNATPVFREVTLTQAGTESGSLVTHFEFAPIEGPFNVGEPIPVTITAVNGNATTAGGKVVADFNGPIALSTNAPCPLSKNKLTMINGMATGEVRCDEPFDGTFLRAHAIGGLTAQSTPFAILSPESETGCIAGKVPDDPFFDPAGGTVTVKDATGTVVAEVTVEHPAFLPILSPRYKVCGLRPGMYTLQGRKGGRLSLPQSGYALAGRTLPLDLQLDVTSRRPVLLVPGFPGSSVRGQFLYPTFHSEAPADPDDLKLLNPLGSVWSDLIGTLQSDYRIIPVPWDWRDINEERITKYLIPAIDRAKQQCDPPCEKVHVIAHSAGGILVRSYIQSDLYTDRNDIDRFAMCGTPNRGAPILYYIWEGGDPLKADNIQDGWFDWWINLYWNTVEELYRSLRGHAPTTLILSDTPQSTPVAVLPLGPSEIRRFIEENVPTAQKLLPAYPFLERIETTRLQGVTQSGITPDFRNSFLWKLNEENSFRWRIADKNNTDPDRVATMVFVGNRKKTVAEIPVGQPGTDGLYWDGQPIGDPRIMTIGDGTVPWGSAAAPLLGVASVDDSKKAKHVDLMNEYATEICTFLNRGKPCAGPPVAGQTVGPPESQLLVEIRGRVEVMLTNPNGMRIGVDPQSGELVQELGDVELEGLPHSTGLAIRNPTTGIYRLSLTTHSNEVFTIVVRHVSLEAEQHTVIHGISTGSLRSLPFALDGGESPTVTFLPEVGAPTNLESKQVDGSAHLMWDPPNDPLVSAYRIYARPDDEPKYVVLGTVEETQVDTGHPWNLAGSAPTWHYIVNAVAADGTESFFTETVENRHPLVPRFSADVTDGTEPLTVSFADESAGEVMAWNWDFDGDGSIDSTEQNPVHEYADPGSYTVSLTVGGPEGTDTTIRPGFITVEPINPPPPPVAGDFDGDGFVTFSDYSEFAIRMTAPFADPTIAGWHLFDLDPDYDVDLRDFREFQKVFGRSRVVIRDLPGLDGPPKPAGRATPRS